MLGEIIIMAFVLMGMTPAIIYNQSIREMDKRSYISGGK